MTNDMTGLRGFIGWNGFIALFLLILSGTGPMAFAAEPNSAVPDAGKRFATVWRIQGDITASGGQNAKARHLREGDLVFVGERIRASAAGEGVLQTDDAGMLAIRPGAEFAAEQFAAEGKPTDSFVVRLFTGSLRVISGWIGTTNRPGQRIVTDTSTIGIRGTDHEPYVLSAELAAATSSAEGTYDKVNRGGTTLEAGAHKLDIDAGRVGFARAAPRGKDRGLITLLLPVLLDKVPSFYVPGRFDGELDQYSPNADDSSLKQLEQKRKASGAAAAAECAPSAIAKTWLERLDGSIARADAATIIGMFAPDVAVRATVLGSDGKVTTLDLKREELVQSTIAAVKELKDYRQRRISMEAKAADGSGTCNSVTVTSVVIEQGLQSGKPFRFESLEQYLLVLRDGNWLAVKAETTQR